MDYLEFYVINLLIASSLHHHYSIITASLFVLSDNVLSNCHLNISRSLNLIDDFLVPTFIILFLSIFLIGLHSFYLFMYTLGLCRTSEIFGVSELVLASSTVLDEKEFKSLSVTSEKWLKITQVSC